MNMNTVIIIFLVILVLFGGIIFYQFSNAAKPKSQLTIANHTFAVEVATSSAEQQKGLSGREKLPDDQGMLFVFKKADKYPFWMEKMKFPLDIIYIKDNKIVSITHSAAILKKGDNNPPIYLSDEPFTQAVEINSGLAKKYGFKKNDAVTIKFEDKLKKAL